MGFLGVPQESQTSRIPNHPFIYQTNKIQLTPARSHPRWCLPGPFGLSEMCQAGERETLKGGNGLLPVDSVTWGYDFSPCLKDGDLDVKVNSGPNVLGWQFV